MKTMRLFKSLCVTMALFVAVPTMAQSENAMQNVSVVELSYMIKEQPKSELGTVVGAVLDVLADQTTQEQPGYVDALRASVIMALGNVRRFTVTDGLQVPPNDETNIIIDGTVNYISTTRELRTHSNKKDKIPEFYAQIGLTLNVKDPATGTVWDSQTFEVNRSSWSWFKSVDSAIKEALEANGLPCLLLDGDGVDSANRSDGQTATRLDAFLELLEARRTAGAAKRPGEVGR